MDLQKVSKAIAGALITGLVGYLADKNIVLGNEVADALNVLLAAIFGFIAVYIAPRNK